MNLFRFKENNSANLKFKVRILVAATLILTSLNCQPVSPVGKPVSVREKKKHCDDQYSDNFANCVNARNPDGSYKYSSIDACYGIANHKYEACLASAGLSPRDYPHPSPPPVKTKAGVRIVGRSAGL
jgi:hypothetical protein